MLIFFFSEEIILGLIMGKIKHGAKNGKRKELEGC